MFGGFAYYVWKKYLNVIALFKEGKIYPQAIIWDDGKKYEIDKILDAKKVAAFNVGGVGTRYTCRIRNKSIYIWLDDNIWFMELKKW
jgi:hypothetical protein